MFDLSSGDFKSVMSTIPSRPQITEIIEFVPASTDRFCLTEQTERSQEVGTVTQFPAQRILPIPDRVLSPEFQEQFWSNVDKANGCWNWTGSIGKDGYGRLRIGSDRAHFRAHRVAYMAAYGKDPAHLYVCHKCDNPACCNPHHLFLGTALENNQDKLSKGRAKYADHSGAKNGNAKLTEESARDVIRLIQLGRTNVEIGKKVGIGHSLVSRVRVGRSWRDLSKSMGYEPKPSKQAPKSGMTKPAPRD